MTDLKSSILRLYYSNLRRSRCLYEQASWLIANVDGAATHSRGLVSGCHTWNGICLSLTFSQYTLGVGRGHFTAILTVQRDVMNIVNVKTGKTITEPRHLRGFTLAITKAVEEAAEMEMAKVVASTTAQTLKHTERIHKEHHGPNRIRGLPKYRRLFTGAYNFDDVYLRHER